MPTGVYIRSKEQNESNRQAQLKRYENPLEHEKSKCAQNRPSTKEKQIKSHTGYKDKPEAKEAKRKAQLKRYQNPLEREKSSKIQLIAQNRPEVKNKISESLIEYYKNNPERREKHRQFMLKFKHSLKTKAKQRKIAIERIEKNLGKVCVNYNPFACEYFKNFDAQHNTVGFYATNGGEHHIKDLGYFVDYINFDLKLIIEWDEEKHYINNILKPKDIQRQKEIQELLPDFEFRRIREKEYRSTL